MIIGLGYKAKSGKDVVADYLVKEYGFQKASFAAALKEACRSIFHLNDRQLYGDLKEVIDNFWNATPRYILQRVGTECMRQGYDQSIWIRSLQRQITNDSNWVVTDVRFLNEAKAVKSWGGKVFRIDRLGGPGASGGIVKHASEIEMDMYHEWDGIIENAGTFEELYKRVDEIIKYIAVQENLIGGEKKLEKEG